MGVTIQQYRARIGAYHNIRIKQNSFSLEDNICLTMLMFIFQCILTIIAAITLVRILYLSIVFYFPAENHTERHILFSNKIFKELTISFTQIFSQLVYVPLLLRTANDVEENPGPTVYDVVDPSQTICADFSQG